MPDDKALAAVRQILREFQAGYTRRDVAALDAFMGLFADDAGLEVIGTNAAEVGKDEWCLGPAAVRKLVEDDWLGWGDLQLDVDHAAIHCLGDAAWLACGGTVSQQLDTQQAYQNQLAFIQTVGAQPKPAEERLLRIMLGCAGTLYELRRGESFVWPLRFTAVLTREGSRWLFRQMQFAFPTTRFPDERIVEPDLPSR